MSYSCALITKRKANNVWFIENAVYIGVVIDGSKKKKRKAQGTHGQGGLSQKTGP